MTQPLPYHALCESWDEKLERLLFELQGHLAVQPAPKPASGVLSRTFWVRRKDIRDTWKLGDYIEYSPYRTEEFDTLFTTPPEGV